MQDLIISLCGDAPRDGSGGNASGMEPSQPALPPLNSPAGHANVSIHVSDVNTGKLIARLDERALATANITALAYSEDTGDLVTGNENGCVHVWSSWRKTELGTAGARLITL